MTKKKYQRNPFRPLITAWVVLFTAIFVLSGYSLSCYLGGKDFTWPVFVFQLFILVSLNAYVMWQSWRFRHMTSASYNIFALAWGASTFWYWTVAPLYGYLTMTFNPSQLAVNAFAFTWEVPVIGTISFTISHILFRPIQQYISTGHTNNPRKLYRLITIFPMTVALQNLFFSLQGYVFGSLQQQALGKMPIIETYKNLGNGIVIGLLLTLFYYYVFDYYLIPIRTRVIRQYDIQNIRTKHFYRRVVGIVTFVTLASLALIVLIYIQSFQHLIQERLISEGRTDLIEIVNEQSHLDVEQVELDKARKGERGQVFVAPQGAPLLIPNTTPETQKAYLTLNDGYIHDQYKEHKLIITTPYKGQRLVSIIYLSDHYQQLSGIFLKLLISIAFIIAIALIVLSISNSILTRAMKNLLAAVKHAEQTSVFHTPDIRTNDEFEALSQAFGHFVEQTQKRSLQVKEEHARLEASINSLQLGYIMTNTTGEILIWNKSAMKMLFDKMIDQPKTLEALSDSLLFPLPLNSYVNKCLKNLKARRVSNVSYGMKFFDFFVAPIMSEHKTLGAAIIIQDVTEQQVLNRSKDEFFSIASHELRTPLTVIRGNTSLIMQTNETLLKKNPELETMIIDMHQASTGLIEIVNDFLDVSRLEQGKMAFNSEVMAIDKIIESTIYEMRAVVREKHIELSSNIKTLGKFPMVWADPGKVKQVLYNLVGNALKFTDKGSITVNLSNDDKFVKVTVTDTGRGIPKENQQLLFHKFQQAGNSLLTRDTTRGTGLGLYISKLMIQNMGGKILLEKSQLDKGSVFSLTLPIAKDAHAKQITSLETTKEKIDAKTGLSVTPPKGA